MEITSAATMFFIWSLTKIESPITVHIVSLFTGISIDYSCMFLIYSMCNATGCPML